MVSKTKYPPPHTSITGCTQIPWHSERGSQTPQHPAEQAGGQKHAHLQAVGGHLCLLEAEDRHSLNSLTENSGNKVRQDLT